MPDTIPLVIGEVLFDQFPDGKRVLGGAPFNVAWNLQGLGISPLFISAIGPDDEGCEILDKMKDWGMDVTGIHFLQDFPTGKVQVQFESGQPSYDILEKQAYDFIPVNEELLKSHEYSLLYTGTLAYRNEITRSTIQYLINELNVPRFVDINIRQPWFDKSWLNEIVGGAKWVKINDEELAYLTGNEVSDKDQIIPAVEKIRSLYGGEDFFVTCGKDGVYAVDHENQLYFTEAPEPENFVDSVGAGDAFAAATITGLLKGSGIQETIENAAKFASRICSLQGATSTNQEIYTGF